MPRKREDGTRAPNMTSSIYRGSDGDWHGRVTMCARDDGKPDRRHVRGRTEADVTRKVRELEKDRDAGRVRRPGRAWTVEKWLSHWVENIAAAHVRPKTLAGYRTAVYRHLVPGIGGRRTDRLQPEHIEKMYAMMRAAGLAPGTVHQAHRTLRTALNEAERRGQIVKNPALYAKTPRLVEQEIEPFTIDEAQRVLAAAAVRRNGVRWAAALSLGLRQGEVLGLQWPDISVDYCPDCRGKEQGSACAACGGAGVVSGTLTIRRALQRHTWQHGCGGSCGRKRGADCPSRLAGGHGRGHQVAGRAAGYRLARAAGARADRPSPSADAGARAGDSCGPVARRWLGLCAAERQADRPATGLRGMALAARSGTGPRGTPSRRAPHRGHDAPGARRTHPRGHAGHGLVASGNDNKVSTRTGRGPAQHRRAARRAAVDTARW